MSQFIAAEDNVEQVSDQTDPFKPRGRFLSQSGQLSLRGKWHQDLLAARALSVGDSSRVCRLRYLINFPALVKGHDGESESFIPAATRLGMIGLPESRRC
ncbi:hypothetical protein GOP47_0027811 [Adiantum capillus-veneris]|nr:hypothetical protein GOP47_0027811 [Adiantum capillus-veneris]